MLMKEDVSTWFMRSLLSHNMLSAMMELSDAAKLQGSYTNHCMRASTIARLKKAGVEDRKICAVSGHKTIQSLQAYDRTTAEEAKRMSEAIDGVVADRKETFGF